MNLDYWSLGVLKVVKMTWSLHGEEKLQNLQVEFWSFQWLWHFDPAKQLLVFVPMSQFGTTQLAENWQDIAGFCYLPLQFCDRKPKSVRKIRIQWNMSTCPPVQKTNVCKTYIQDCTFRFLSSHAQSALLCALGKLLRKSMYLLYLACGEQERKARPLGS